jgi:hypothetical protein
LDDLRDLREREGVYTQSNARELLDGRMSGFYDRCVSDARAQDGSGLLLDDEYVFSACGRISEEDALIQLQESRQRAHQAGVSAEEQKAAFIARMQAKSRHHSVLPPERVVYGARV